MWQEIAIIIIGLVTAVYIGWKVYNFIHQSSSKKNPCCGCTGCTFKRNPCK